eukprot:44763-Prymnesium_polylepis.1
MADRALTITGSMDALPSAFVLIADVARSEAGHVDSDSVETVRLLIPDAVSLVGDAALTAMRKASGGARIEVFASPLGGKDKLLACTGSAEQTAHVALNVAEAVAARHNARHRDFFAQWRFETCYNDHFETPA